MSVMPPAIDSLGRSSGFSLALQARTGQSQAELRAALQQLLKLAEASPLLSEVHADGLPAGTSVRLDIDRAKAEAMGVGFEHISSTLSAAMGSQYVNDFPNKGRLQQVILQADAPHRMELEDVLKLYVRNSEGGMVALSELVTPHWTEAPLQLQRYLGFPALNLSGAPASGVSTGQAMAEMERLAGSCRPASPCSGPASRCRSGVRRAGAVAAAVVDAGGVPGAGGAVRELVDSAGGDAGGAAGPARCGRRGAVARHAQRRVLQGRHDHRDRAVGEERDPHRRVRAPAAAAGRGLVEAALEAARLRLRPIVMTSLAFALGVVPLMLAQGASKETQQAIGTGVFGGMVSATVLAVFFVPVFYVVVQGARQWIAQRLRRRRPMPEGSVDGTGHR
jgi:multidrug efflux pump